MMDKIPGIGDRRERPSILPWPKKLADVPWWGVVLAIFGLVTLYAILTSAGYQETLAFLSEGILVTIRISLVAFVISIVFGLITGLGRVSKNPLSYALSTLYVEVVRGIPLLVQILYIGYVLAPQIGLQDRATRGILGLAVCYGAYSAEIFRAGIESIEKGQMEAARSLGMTYFQAMRYIVLPQAIRRVLPPLGNDFISMLKDSSLVSVLSVKELTMLGRMNTARTFRTFQTWNMVALLYLVMTLVLSRVVRYIERRMHLE